MKNKEGKEGKESRENKEIPQWELLCAAAGAALFAAAAAYLVLEGFRNPEGVPDPRVRVTAIDRIGPRWLVRFRAENAGTGTAQDLEFIARLDCGDGRTESAEVRLEYLPPASAVKGGVYFGRNPERCALDFVPEGFTDP